MGPLMINMTNGRTDSGKVVQYSVWAESAIKLLMWYCWWCKILRDFMPYLALSFVIYVSVPVSWLSYKSPILELPIKNDFPNQPCRTQIKLSAFGIQKIVQNTTNKPPVPGRKRLFLSGKIFQGFKSMSVHALSWKCHLLFRLCKHLLNWVSQHQKLWLTFSKLVVRDNSE